MRMTRARHRRMLRRKAPGYHKGKRIAAGMLIGMSAALPLKAQAAMTVLHDIKSDFDYMEDSFSNIKALDAAKEYVAQAENNVALAQQALQEAEENCLEAAENLSLAQGSQKEAREIVAQSQQELQATKARRVELTKEAIAAQQAVADYLPTWYAAQGELQQRVDVQEAAALNRPAGSYGERVMSESEAQRAQWIAQAWAEAGYESNRLPEIEAQFSGGNTAADAEAAAAAQAELDAYWERMAELESATDSAREYFDSVSEHLDDLKAQQQEAEEAEAETRQEVLLLETELGQNQQGLRDANQEADDAQRYVQEAEANRQQANEDLDAAIQDMVQARYSLQHFGEGMGMQKTLEYYSWQGAGNRSGHQLYNGNSFYWSRNNYEFTLSNGTVMSNTGLENGNMSGLTDTTISAMYTNKHPIFDVKYGLEINLPTGSSRTHYNAIVPDFLARVSRLSEGWNFTPRVDVTKHIGKYTTWHWRSSYSLRGAYEEEYDDGIGTMHPGDQWSTELEFLHTDAWQQYMMKLQYVNNDSRSVVTGLRNDNGFVEGDNLNARAYGRFWFTPKDSWALYTIWSLDKAAVFENTDIASGSGIHRLYYGAGYYHQFDARRQLRIFGNWMRSTGEAYDPLANQNYASGRRFSVSLGYDWRMDDRNSLSLDLERAVLRQQGADNYRSWGVMLNYNRSF